MKKPRLPIVVGIILLIILGVFVFFKISSDKKELAERPDKATIKSILGFAGSLECSFVDGKGNSGVISGKNVRVRGDLELKNNRKKVKSHVMYDAFDSQTLYVWFDDSKEGYKAPITVIESIELEDPDRGINISQEVNYECHKWEQDPSIFELPKDIEFVNYGVEAVPTPTTRPVADITPEPTEELDSDLLIKDSLH